MPGRHRPDAIFRNQASDARFENYASGVIFCDHASDMQYEASYVVRESFSINKICIDLLVNDLKSVGPLEFKLVALMPEHIKTTAMHFY